MDVKKEIKRNKKGLVTGLNYQKYYAGYSKIRVLAKHGEGYRMERVYTDDWYVVKTERPGLRKLGYGILTFLAIICYVCGAQSGASGNKELWVAGPGLLSFFCFIFSVWSVLGYAVSRRKLTEWDYRKCHETLRYWALATGILLTVLAITAAVCVAIHPEDRGTELQTALLYLAGAFCMLLLWNTERNAVYVRDRNDALDTAELWEPENWGLESEQSKTGDSGPVLTRNKRN